MHRRFVIAAILVSFAACFAGTGSAAEETLLLRFPDIHNGQIVFSYDGDLWTVSDDGGIARRLTSHTEGLEWYPKFSPDGKSIAFTGDYDGNYDVYVMPAIGGEPICLTYHPEGDRVIEWTPDGKVMFTSRRNSHTRRITRLYTVPVTGGLPEPMPMNTGVAASFSPDGEKIAFNRIDRDRRTWKRYKGGMAQDIWIFDLIAKKTTRLTTYEGTDAFPMWYGDRIYFVSDRDYTANLYVYELKTGEIRKLTNHTEYDVKWPSMGPGQIVYENGGAIWVFDMKTEKTRKVPIFVPTDRLAARARWIKLGRDVKWGSISPSGKRAALQARGEIFSVPAEKGPTRNLTRTSGIRERNPVWSPDGRWIAYFSDKTGEMEIYIRPSDGKGNERRVTRGGKVFRFGLKWSPDSKKLLFGDKDQKLFWVNVKSGAIHEIDRSEAFEIRRYNWSPDSRWVAYEKVEVNRLSSIYLYSLEARKSYAVTDSTTDDCAPVFDPGGKYLYFLSKRDIKPYLDVFDATYILKDITKLYAVTLAADEPSPFAPESDEEGTEADEEEKNGDDDDSKDESEKDGSFRIDIDGIKNRIVAFPIKSGPYAALAANEKSVFFLSVPRKPLVGTWDKEQKKFVLNRFDMEKRKLKKVISGISGYDLSADGKKILYFAENQIGIIDASAKGKHAGEGKLDLSQMEMHLDPPAEWRQIFDEAWRLERDFFYDPGMHGVDWKGIKKRYAGLLPYVSNREDLNYLLGEMIGELNCSHTYVWGGDRFYAPSPSVGLLGADLELDPKAGLYKLAKIYPPDEWNLENDAPLAQPGLDIREGDYILAVNGEKLEAPDNPYRLFVKTADRQVRLTVASGADGKDARDVVVVPIRSDVALRYRAWVNENRRRVDEATDGRIGYVHIPNMSASGLKEFTKGFVAQIDKQGLIIDIRYNSGGFVSEMILEKLRRELAGMFSSRNAMDFSYPWQVIHGPMVCIINEYAGSDGDIFPYFFRKYGLGKIVGRRTWGGVVGIRLNKLLIDGGMLTMPEYGTYGLEREWIIEGYGVDPDVEVDLLPEDVLAGRDPQLEKAIEIALKELKTNPGKFPKRPDRYPRPNERKQR